MVTPGIEPLAVAGAFVVTPHVHRDERGEFAETYRAADLAAILGHAPAWAQGNTSFSRWRTLRGLHYSRAGQAKYVMVPRGEIWDVLVDVRVGSPTWGAVARVRLDDVARRAVYIPAGVAHGFAAAWGDAVVTYLCSTPYDPGAEHTLQALDPALAIDWGVPEPIRSGRDETAPILADAAAAGLLPRWTREAA